MQKGRPSTTAFTLARAPQKIASLDHRNALIKKNKGLYLLAVRNAESQCVTLDLQILNLRHSCHSLFACNIAPPSHDTNKIKPSVLRRCEVDLAFHLCASQVSSVCLSSFICVPLKFHLCASHVSSVCPSSFICVPLKFHLCASHVSSVCLSSFICAFHLCASQVSPHLFSTWSSQLFFLVSPSSLFIYIHIIHHHLTIQT